MKAMAIALLLFGCVTPAAWAQRTLTNPPPATKLADFGTFELRKLATPPLRNGSAEEAAQRLDGHLASLIKPLIAKWSAHSSGMRSLVIEPVVTELHYVSEKVRSWGGQFTSDSFVTLKLRLTDASSGELIAEPEFYQHTSMVNGATKKGVADRNMLRLVARLAASYLEKNHDAAVGGPTGRE